MYKRIVDEVATPTFFDFDDFVVTYLDGRPPLLIKNVLIDDQCGYQHSETGIEIDYNADGHTYIKYTAVIVERVDTVPSDFYQVALKRLVDRTICVDGLASFLRLPDYWALEADEYQQHYGDNNKIPTEKERDDAQPKGANFILLEDTYTFYTHDENDTRYF